MPARLSVTPSPRPHGSTCARASVLAALLCCFPASASAQYATDFESATIEASEAGTILTDQDEFYVPSVGGSDVQAYLYEGNDLGIPSNPDGGEQFVAGEGLARAQRDVPFGDGTGAWIIRGDLCISYVGAVPAADFLGSFSTQDNATTAGFIGPLLSWTDTAAAANWDMQVSRFTDVGGTVQTDVPAAGFTGLELDTWYRFSVRFDFDTNQILEVTIEDIETDALSSYAPADWYLGGGTTPLPTPTGFRFFIGTVGSIVAWDNISIARDCNSNGIDDAADITDGTSEDCDSNDIPDECQLDSFTNFGTLTQSDADAGDLFGNAVAARGDLLVVGARSDDEAAENAGAAYVFRLDAGVWTEEAKLTASDGAAADEFGYSVAVDDDVVVVGARRVDSGTLTNAGAAYVYRYSGGTWTEEDKLTAAVPAASDELGYSVAVSGDVAAVSAHLDDDEGSGAGAVYLFRHDDDAWSEEIQLTASDAAATDQFGRAVALCGDWLAAGSPNEDDGGSNAGAVYLFSFDGVDWAEEDKLLASDAGAGDAFGSSVAIFDDVLVAGGPLEDTGGVNSGAAYVFRNDAGAWDEEQKIAPEAPDSEAEFGNAVAVFGDLIAAGAHHDIDDNGAVYVFGFSGSAWSELGKQSTDDGGSASLLGTSVAVLGNGVLGGALEGDGAGVDSGAVHTASLLDCNANDVPDSCEIADGRASDDNLNGVIDDCEKLLACIGTPASGGTPAVTFERGDADGNGGVSALLDALFLLTWQFSGGPTPPCMDAADADGNNGVTALLDALFLLSWQFTGGPAPPDPGPSTCGEDKDTDSLTCETPSPDCD